MNFNFFAVTLLSLSIDCYGNVENQLKNKVIEDIIQKIHNISTNTFSKMNPKAKEEALLIINMELSKAMKDLGPNMDRYIDIIKEGIKMAHPKILDSKSKILRGKAKYGTQNYTKKKMFTDIVIKPKYLRSNYTHEIKTVNEKLKKIKDGWQKLADNIDRKHFDIRYEHNQKKPFYEHVQSKDAYIALQKNTYESRRILEKLIKNIINDTKYNNTTEKNTGNQFKMATDNYLDTVTNSLPCETAIEVSCRKIRSVNKLICPLDRKEISINKLCNGVFDCHDGFDESHCILIAAAKLKETNSITSQIETSVLKQCSYTYFDNSIFSKQNVILRELLQIQQNFLRNRTQSVESLRKDMNIEKRTVNEIAMIINSLSMSLEASLCPQHTNEENIINIYQRSNDVYRRGYNVDNPDKNQNDFPNEKMIQSRKCNCERGFCTESKCNTICKSVCWQKYSLGRWSCPAVIGGNTVALDQICDGKLDCHDGTDESGCAKDSHVKFDAVDIYTNVLKMLMKKASIEEHSYVRKRLLNLYNNIKTLHELSMNYRPDPVLIKPLRDACFAELITIYEDMLSKENTEVLDEKYMFLLSINEKLVSALKLTHTGNDKIITMNGCYCKDNLCAITKCTKICHRQCAAEDTLTKYMCKQRDTIDNISISIDAVCNGKADCPQGDDELDCKKDMCRVHHLLLLKYYMQVVGGKQKGTAVGELLSSWKTKVLSTLMIAETTGRPTPSTIKDVIRAVLRDLLATYGSFDPSRRASNDESVLNEFINISQRVIKTLKSCGN